MILLGLQAGPPRTAKICGVSSVVLFKQAREEGPEVVELSQSEARPVLDLPPS